ncbi:MAG: VOC family protein [Gemmataceae bacterium]
MGVKPIPEGFHSVNPSLHIKDVPAAIAFYKEAFGATELMRLEMAPGVIAHAEVKIGDSVIMMAEESPDWGNKAPGTLGGTPVNLMVYVEDVDAVFAKAVAAGGKPTRPVEDQFWGDRMGNFIDPFGHSWTVATHVEDVSAEECKARMMKLYAPAA